MRFIPGIRYDRDADGKERGSKFGRDRCLLYPLCVSLLVEVCARVCVCPSYERAAVVVHTTCTSSIIHSFALSESGRLITVQPEGRRGESDLECVCVRVCVRTVGLVVHPAESQVS